MGNSLTSLYYWLFPQKPLRLLILGLDSAGKTTLLYQLKLGELVTTIPTIGFNVESVQYRNITFTMWDVCSSPKLRPLWRHYFPHSQGVIFVIDSTDRERLSEAMYELQVLLEAEELQNAVYLIFANKQDVAGAMTENEITEHVVGLETRMRSRRWRVVGCSAKLGTGFEQGLEWVAEQLRNS